jgi:hypothetical protein
MLGRRSLQRRAAMCAEQRAGFAWTAAGFANRYDDAPTSDMEKRSYDKGEGLKTVGR